MTKAFAIALLAPALAFAKGDNSGFGSENAIETVLLSSTDEWDPTLTLSTYNVLNGDVPELHGDLILTYPDSPQTGPVCRKGLKNTCQKEDPQFYQFCIQTMQTPMEMWDCQRFEFSLIEGSRRVGMGLKSCSTVYDDTDSRYKHKHCDEQGKNKYKDPSISWVNIKSKNEITGCEQSQEEDWQESEQYWAKYYFKNCSKVSAHFYRNFANSQDLQLSLEDVDKKFKVFGQIGSPVPNRWRDGYVHGAQTTGEKVRVITKEVQLVYQATADAAKANAEANDATSAAQSDYAVDADDAASAVFAKLEAQAKQIEMLKDKVAELELKAAEDEDVAEAVVTLDDDAAQIDDAADAKATEVFEMMTQLPEGCTIGEDGLVNCDPTNTPAVTGLPKECKLDEDGKVTCLTGYKNMKMGCYVNENNYLKCHTRADYQHLSKWN